MNKGLWIARKNYLWTLIKKVSDAYGGDDMEWLREHFTQVIEGYYDEKIEEAITCYSKMVEQLKH